MLLLVRSRGVVFTAFITSTLSRTVQGQVIVLMMIMIMAPATGGTSAVSSSLLVLFVKFCSCSVIVRVSVVLKRTVVGD